MLRTGKERAVHARRRGDPARERDCLPSATQCQAIELQVGQTETLEVVEPNGSPVTYELQLVEHRKLEHRLDGAGRDAFRAQSKAARELLRHAAAALSGLHYSPRGAAACSPAIAAFAAARSRARAATRR